MKRSLLLITLFVISLLAFAVRFVDLDRRPMHHDEANQALRSGELLENGVYHYDPEDHHGPSLYYLSVPVAWATAGRHLTDTTEITWRLVPVLFGSGLILLLWFLRDGLGKGGVIGAAVLTAVSPAMVYYSRFYIQEMLLVFFTLAAIAAGWRYARAPSYPSALLTGCCLAMMYATKETAVLAWFSMAVALVAVLISQKDRSQWLARPGFARHVTVALVAAALTHTLFFTSFFTNPGGVLDSVLAYHVYLARGLGDSLHRHPPLYYLELILFHRAGRGPTWTEGFIVGFAVVGAVWAWSRRDASRSTPVTLPRFLAVYSLVLTLTYSLIPHKTPWCLISFLHGMILLAGWAIAECLIWPKGKVGRLLLGTLVVALLVHLGWLAYQANLKFPPDPSNPYAYVETSADLLNLARRVEDISAVAVDGRDMLIEVVTDPYDTWPIPWYLRRHRAGYWNSFADVPREPLPTILITSPLMEQQVPAGIRENYQVEFFGLRPNVLLLVYIRPDAWNAFISRR